MGGADKDFLTPDDLHTLTILTISLEVSVIYSQFSENVISRARLAFVEVTALILPVVLLAVTLSVDDCNLTCSTLLKLSKAFVSVNLSLIAKKFIF